MKKEPIILDTFDGHIVLLCKGWYYTNNIDFFDTIRRLWCIRCGIPNEYATEYMDENIADRLYKIMATCSPERMDYFHEVLHREICKKGDWSGKPKNLTCIQKLIWEYRSFLLNLKVRDNGKVIISLPKPQQRIIKRIVRGNGVYKDYDKLTKADKRIKS